MDGIVQFCRELHTVVFRFVTFISQWKLLPAVLIWTFVQSFWLPNTYSPVDSLVTTQETTYPDFLQIYLWSLYLKFYLAESFFPQVS